MQPRYRLRGAGVIGLIALLLLLPSAGTAWSQDVACGDVAERDPPVLNILSLNILFSQDPEMRDASLNAVADFVQDRSIDAVLLQEVVGGLLAGTANSAADLQRFLADRGLAFERRTAIEFGVPGLLVVANATLSRCDIVLRLVDILPPASELAIAGEVIELPRNVLMTRIAVPGFGAVNVYNTHLCAFCTPGERGEQLEELLDFVDDVEDFLPGEDPIVLAGDFNIDRFRPGDRRLYNEITRGNDFIDAYFQGAKIEVPNLLLNDLCESSLDPDEHCTFGVTTLDPTDAGRIDYIFIKNFEAVVDATVLFNTLIDGEPTVSDHAGVLVSVELPEAEALW